MAKIDKGVQMLLWIEIVISIVNSIFPKLNSPWIEPQWTKIWHTRVNQLKFLISCKFQFINDFWICWILFSSLYSQSFLHERAEIRNIFPDEVLWSRWRKNDFRTLFSQLCFLFYSSPYGFPHVIWYRQEKGAGSVAGATWIASNREKFRSLRRGTVHGESRIKKIKKIQPNMPIKKVC